MLLKFSARGNLNAILLRIILQAYVTSWIYHSFTLNGKMAHFKLINLFKLSLLIIDLLVNQFI